MSETDISQSSGFSGSLIAAAQAAQESGGQEVPAGTDAPSQVEGTPDVPLETVGSGDTAIERPRDEHGRFTSREQEPAGDEFQLDPDVQRFLSKYGGDVQAALRGAAEQQVFTSRQSNEIGDLRRQLEQFQQQMMQETRQSVDWDTLMENPSQAVQVAFQQGNAPMLQQAFAQWADEDPGAAWSWRSDRMIEVQRQQIMQEIDQRIGPVVQQTSEQQFAQAMAGLARQYPDLEQMAPAMAQIAQERPHVLDGLQTANPQKRAEVLEDLYHLARSRNAPQIAAAIQQAQAAQAAEADRAKQEAFVASGSMSAPPMSEQALTPEQVLQNHMLDRQKVASFSDGWSVDPANWRK